MSSPLHLLLKTSRPRFWLYVLGPFLLGWASGGPLNNLTPTNFLLLFAGIVFFSFPANVFIYGVNDLYDRETDQANNKKHGYESLLPPTHYPLIRRTALASLFVGAMILLLFFTFQDTFLALEAAVGFSGFFFFSWQYSAPPIRAKIRPFFDSAFNILYVFPALVGHAIVNQAHVFPSLPLLLAGSFWCMAMHAFSAVPDIHADQQAGLTTIATTLGKQKTLAFCATLYLIAGILAWPWLGFQSLIGTMIYLFLMAVASQQKNEANLLRLYRWFPWVNNALGLLIWLRVMNQG